MSVVNTEKKRSKTDGGRIKQLAVSDTGFVFDPQTGQSFTVNRTGRLVLDCLKDLQEDEGLELAARQLSERCSVPYELAKSSVEAFLLQLGRYL